jgi:hypothetical protein
LEQRTLLASFTPLVAAADGAVNSLRAAIVASNGNGQNDTITLQTGTYNLTLANTAGQENNAARAIWTSRRPARPSPSRATGRPRP